MRGKSGIVSSTRQLLMDIHENNTDYEFKTYGMYSFRSLNRNEKGFESTGKIKIKILTWSNKEFKNYLILEFYERVN